MKTTVVWDIETCPVPEGYDASLVGPCIRSALKKAGYGSDSTTITAIGNLTYIRHDLLRGLFCSGISLQHDDDYLNTIFTLNQVASTDPLPSNLVVITGRLQTYVIRLRGFQARGCKIHLVYPEKPDPRIYKSHPGEYGDSKRPLFEWRRWVGVDLRPCSEWLWNSLLDHPDRDLVEDDKPDECGWLCNPCADSYAVDTVYVQGRTLDPKDIHLPTHSRTLDTKDVHRLTEAFDCLYRDHLSRDDHIFSECCRSASDIYPKNSPDHSKMVKKRKQKKTKENNRR